MIELIAILSYAIINIFLMGYHISIDYDRKLSGERHKKQLGFFLLLLFLGIPVYIAVFLYDQFKK